ncbi:hypothetical protein NJBCHELONAE_35900 [Mycobacteroides chelonae]|nr:hypothetical protein NJBCHELONAE_35900 [Mycobacteroides chelonae]
MSTAFTAVSDSTISITAFEGRTGELSDHESTVQTVSASQVGSAVRPTRVCSDEMIIGLLTI